MKRLDVKKEYTLDSRNTNGHPCKTIRKMNAIEIDMANKINQLIDLANGEDDEECMCIVINGSTFLCAKCVSELIKESI